MKIEKILLELDSMCATYITDHASDLPELELPIKLYDRLCEHFSAKVRILSEVMPQTTKLAAYKFNSSGIVTLKPYDGMYPRIRPSKKEY